MAEITPSPHVLGYIGLRTPTKSSQPLSVSPNNYCINFLLNNNLSSKAALTFEYSRVKIRTTSMHTLKTNVYGTQSNSADGG